MMQMMQPLSMEKLTVTITDFTQMEALIPLLDSGVLDTRETIQQVRLLATCQQPFVLAAMKRWVLSPNPLIGQVAVDYVAGHDSDPAQYLMECLPDSTYMVRISIVQALGELKSTSAVPTLLDLLEAPNQRGSTLRLTVIKALGKIGDPTIVDRIRPYLNDDDAHVRQNVAATLAILEATSQESNS